MLETLSESTDTAPPYRREETRVFRFIETESRTEVSRGGVGGAPGITVWWVPSFSLGRRKGSGGGWGEDGPATACVPNATNPI